MKQTLKKVSMYAIVGVMAVTSYVGYTPSSASAATATETETISLSYKMPDTVGVGFGTEPTGLGAIEVMVATFGASAPGRTGWAAKLYECVADNSGGNIAPFLN